MPLAGIAQPLWLNDVSQGLESRHFFYTTKWICTGDTLAVENTESNGVLVKLDGFWITCNEITNDLWHWYIAQDLELIEDALIPKTAVSPKEIEAFCHQINISTHAKWRLPTRKEWLFAFHGGLFSEGYIYSGSNRADLVAWTKGNSGGKPHVGGQRIANELGLYDLSGNVAEMATEGDSIVFLGGSFDEEPIKGDQSSTPQAKACGFRLVWHQPLWFDSYGQRIFED